MTEKTEEQIRAEYIAKYNAASSEEKAAFEHWQKLQKRLEELTKREPDPELDRAREYDQWCRNKEFDNKHKEIGKRTREELEKTNPELLAEYLRKVEEVRTKRRSGNPELDSLRDELYRFNDPDFALGWVVWWEENTARMKALEPLKLSFSMEYGLADLDIETYKRFSFDGKPLPLPE